MRPQAEKKELISAGIRISYVKRGSGHPLILLHGNGESHSLFDDAAEILSDEYEVYTPDTRGHGDSEGTERLRYDDMAGDIISLIRHENLTGDRRPVLFGFSDGGITGLLAAMRCPDAFDRLIVAGVNLTPGGLTFGTRMLMRLGFLFTRSDKLRLMLTQPDIKAEHLNVIKIPVFVFRAEKDVVKLSHSRTVTENVSNGKLIVLENETHESYVRDNKKLCALLTPILDGNV